MKKWSFWILYNFKIYNDIWKIEYHIIYLTFYSNKCGHYTFYLWYYYSIHTSSLSILFHFYHNLSLFHFLLLHLLALYFFFPLSHDTVMPSLVQVIQYLALTVTPYPSHVHILILWNNSLLTFFFFLFFFWMIDRFCFFYEECFKISTLSSTASPICFGVSSQTMKQTICSSCLPKSLRISFQSNSQLI